MASITDVQTPACISTTRANSYLSWTMEGRDVVSHLPIVSFLQLPHRAMRKSHCPAFGHPPKHDNVATFFEETFIVEKWPSFLSQTSDNDRNMKSASSQWCMPKLNVIDRWFWHQSAFDVTISEVSGLWAGEPTPISTVWLPMESDCWSIDYFSSTCSRQLGFVSRLYPTPLPRPISIQYSVTWRPTSSLSPCDTTIHLFAQGPISVFVSRYTWYECAAGREKQSKNLIEKTYSWTCCTTAMTCQGPRIHLSGPATWKWALLGTRLKKRRRRRNERDKKKETKDENGKWREMHRLIKKTIELFYMDTF